MYYHFFGFSTNPFSSIPQSNSNYLPKDHQSFLNQLITDINKKTGISLLVGAAGVGKTSLIKKLISDHSTQDVGVVLIDLNTYINLSAAESDNIVLAMEAKLTDSDQPHVLLLDQADNVNDEILVKILSVVSKRNKNNQPTLLILIGLPQLESRLGGLQFQSYKSILNKPLVLNELNQKAVKDYILHRMHIAGYSKKSLFTDDAIRSITELSEGVPQIINTLCGNSLFQASLDQTHIITEETVNNATEFFFLEKDALKEELTEILPPPVSPSLPSKEQVENTTNTLNADQTITQSLEEVTQMLSEVSQIKSAQETTPAQDIQYKSILEQQATEEETSDAKPLDASIPERSSANTSKNKPAENSNLSIPASTFATAKNAQPQSTTREDNDTNRAIPNQPNSNDKHIGHIYKISLVAVSVLLAIVTFIWILKSQFIDENTYNAATNEKTIIAIADESELIPQHLQSENETDKTPHITEKPLNTTETITTPIADNIRPQSSELPAQPITPSAIKKPEVVSELKSTETTSNINNKSTKAKIQTLLSLAQVQEKNNHLTQPIGDNLIETLKRILKLDPSNIDATLGIKRIKEIFIRQAEREKNQEQWKKAEASFIKVQRIDPRNLSIVNSLANVRQQMQTKMTIINQATIPKPLERPKSKRSEPDSLELAAEARAAARYKLSLLGIPYNYNSFLTAAENGDDTRLKLFLDANMPVNAQDSLRNTALIKAATQGHIGAVKLLLNKKPAINWQNQYGKTALMLAAEKNQYNVVKTLLMRGANQNLEDAAGQTALSVAKRNQHHKIVFLLLSAQ